jgi:mannitol/fructose-specific phosphotransferase system IIA component (Ntr-type)
MKLSKLLSVDQILLDMNEAEHWPAIVELVDHLVILGHLPEALRDTALDALKQREDLISTGIGTGVAIPHAFLDEIEYVTAVFGRSSEGIDFEALDDFPVHFIVLFLVPRTNYSLHLQTLAAIAKLFARGEIRACLHAAKSPQEILDAFSCKNPVIPPFSSPA